MVTPLPEIRKTIDKIVTPEEEAMLRSQSTERLEALSRIAQFELNRRTVDKIMEAK